jgi:hypothetical protein
VYIFDVDVGVDVGVCCWAPCHNDPTISGYQPESESSIHQSSSVPHLTGQDKAQPAVISTERWTKLWFGLVLLE